MDLFNKQKWEELDAKINILLQTYELFNTGQNTLLANHSGVIAAFEALSGKFDALIAELKKVQQLAQVVHSPKVYTDSASDRANRDIEEAFTDLFRN